MFYDITASPEERSVDRSWIDRIAQTLNIPFCVAGGIKSIADAEAVLNRGADKISVNTPALSNPDLINELAHRFGSQCVVVGIDSKLTDAGWVVHQFTGDPDKSREADRQTLDWVREVQLRGAGEIVLNCMDKDGVRDGYDIAQLQAAREVCQVPLIASGGAGRSQHFIDVFQQCQVDGALAASVFHDARIAIPDLRTTLKQANIAVRPFA